jgi:hypothetical protein
MFELVEADQIAITVCELLPLRSSAAMIHSENLKLKNLKSQPYPEIKVSFPAKK